VTEEPQPQEGTTEPEPGEETAPMPTGEEDGAGPVIDNDATVVADEPPPPHLPDETSWICEMLHVDPADWTDIVSVARLIPAYESAAALLALEQVDTTLGRGVFDQGYVTTLRLIDLPGHDETHSVPALGSHLAFTVPDPAQTDESGEPDESGDDEPPSDPRIAVARIEQDLALAGESRLVTFGIDEATARAGQEMIWSLVRGRCSTWRRRTVVFDPTPSGLVRSLRSVGAAPSVSPPEAAQLEFERSILAPLRSPGDGASSAANVIVSGVSGSGKTALIDWLLAELAGSVTAIVIPARVLASPDLIHIAYEMAADDLPSLIVLDHLDLLLGDRYSMRFPESLAELIAQLDDLIGHRGTITVATVSTTDPLDAVLLGRFQRTIELGEAPPGERRRAIETLGKEFDVDDGQVAMLVKHVAGWSPRQLAELVRLASAASAATADGVEIDLLALASRVDEPVRASGDVSEDGSYL
jgi:hypothetical protein